MNILIVGPALSIKGGMSTVIRNLLDSRLKLKYHMLFLSSIEGGNILKKFVSEICSFIKYLQKVKWADIVHIHMASRRSTFRKMKYIKIAHRGNKKIILHIHGGGFKDFYNKCNAKQKKNILAMFKMCNQIIVLTEEWKKYFEQLVDPSRISVIYNGVKKNSEKRQIFNHHFCFVGRIVKEKGVYELGEACNIVKQKYPDAKLSVAGDGPELKNLKNIVTELALNDSVEFLGWLQKDTLENLYRKNTFFVLPSYFEAFPMSLIEAMSNRCVVISSKVGGVPTIIDDERDGFLVNPKDSNDLAKKICLAMSSLQKQKDIGYRAQEKVNNNFSIDQSIAKIGKIYSNNKSNIDK